MSDKAHSVTSFGFRLIDAGSYDSVRSFGNLKTSGDLEAQRLRTFGDCEIRGRCVAKHVLSAGNLHVQEALHVGTLRSFGDVTIEAQLIADQLRSMGDLTVTGRVRCHRFHLWGDATLEEDLVADQLSLTGTCRIRGLVSAEHVRIRSRRHCTLHEIGGRTIVIRAGWDEEGRSGKRGFLPWRCKGSTTVRLIEGDHISLENTRAEMVRGQFITIGAGCQIDSIEYADDLKLHPSAVVRTVTHCPNLKSSQAQQETQ